MLAVDKLNVIRQVAAAMLSVVQRLVVITPPPIAEYCDEPVCVCVCMLICPRSYLWNYTSDLQQIFCACYLWPWLGPSLAA